ncbi:DNA-binding protein [Ktedonosporobacter rubrisoli]|uniref:DNA-binding protein n=1 Tax=Ktedonosporobacter rubrisoli TaxID=2509675 RepID=A0A4P6JYL5_KTERU|nr:helix-turn-helix domain-containing protein [Ktedonosporobacter rubrisoli]QBD80540.1 DNA-binding protein [Ktedonosporobacter rubrisoli]
MKQEYYDAKQVAEILKVSIPTVYRKAKAGDIPSVGKRPNIKFPKPAIDAIAEVGANDDDEDGKLSFTLSTIADAWTKQEITQQPYEDEDVVPFKTLLEWRKRNNEISMNLKEGNKILGWTTFLPLDENIIKALIRDEIREKDIPLESIRKWTDSQLTVYIPIIEVIPSGNPEKDARRGQFLIRKTIRWALMLTIQHDIKKWYGIGVTPEGQALLEAMGFKLILSLEDGKRKGYALETRAEPVRLIGQFLRNMEASGMIPEKATSLKG